jgi:hypothetical protein
MLKEKLPGPKTGIENPDGGYWYDGFTQYAADKNNWKGNSAGWGLPIDCFKNQANDYKKNNANTVVIVVTDQSGKLIDPTQYRLWIRGFRNPESFLEDIPPVVYPPPGG